MDKIIVHIDLNCFFVQCEIREHPELAGKPVAIGHEGKRGVISTSSYEARALGVFSGMPVSTARAKSKDLILVPGHYSLYQRYSKNFFSFLKKKYPVLEQASIDECYIDMTKEADREHLHDYLFDLSMELYRATKLKCSIGCGWTKFLAKMGSDYKKPLGITIFTRENFQEMLFPLSIDKMFGIGKKSAPKLVDLGIKTIGDFYHYTFPEEKKILGSYYETLKDLLNGLGDDFVDSSSFDPKSISAERTFLNDESNEDEISEMIYQCAKDCHKELVKYHKVTDCIGLKYRTPDFVTKSKRLSIEKKTDSLEVISSIAQQIFQSIYHGQSFRLIGVMLERVETISYSKERDQSFDSLLSSLNEKLSSDNQLTTLGKTKHESQ